MNTNIEITELFLLKGLMGNFTQDDILKIREYFVKTKHRSKVDSYKPGSPEHAERLAEDAKIIDSTRLNPDQIVEIILMSIKNHYQ